MTRQGEISRKTKETEIKVVINLDGEGNTNISTGIGFLNHMLTAFAVHGKFNLEVKAIGDLDIDTHHTVEDIAICLGLAIQQAIGEKRGIERMADSFVPMDESLVRVVLDLSGRPYFVSDFKWDSPLIGSISSQIIKTSEIEHFLETLAFRSLTTLHIKVFYGRDDHHMSEAVFKALGRALYKATRIVGTTVPSSKGIL